MLTYTENRFLSLQETITRILDLWDVLGQYKLKYNVSLAVNFNEENKIYLIALQALLGNQQAINENLTFNNLTDPDDISYDNEEPNAHKAESSFRDNEPF